MKEFFSSFFSSANIIGRAKALIIKVSDLASAGFQPVHYRLHLNQTSRRSSLTAGLLIVIPK